MLDAQTSSRSLARALIGCSWLCGLAFAAWLAIGSPSGAETLFDLWLYNASILFAGLACFARAREDGDAPGAWICIGAGLTAWAAADVYYVLALEDLTVMPYPSLADAGFLLALPCLFAGIAILGGHRFGRFTLASWIDGAIAALAFGAVATALVAPALIGLGTGGVATVLTNLAYPVGDLTLLAFVVALLVVSGFRGARQLMMIGAGILIWSGADIVYLRMIATDSYAGGAIDLLWPLGAAIIGTSAILPADARVRRRTGAQSTAFIPVVATAIAISLLIRDHFAQISSATVWLAGATMIAVAARLYVSFCDNRRLVARLRRESVTDPLTGLGNRRRLFTDLDQAFIAPPPAGKSRYLAMLDLNGFKDYNDRFGHAAGDSLLRRLGGRLRNSTAGLGSAYRLGGDEFCAIFHVQGDDPSLGVEVCRQALSDHGDGFAISVSGGFVDLGREASSPADALRIADQRMYDEKGSRARAIEHRETHEVLLSALREREPDLGLHLDGVAELAVRTAAELGIDGSRLEEIRRAAALHDIGKIAIPDAILRKPGPLDGDEWELMREHTLIGERILAAAPAMREIGSLVRSSHERWDGCGYPDGKRGEETPLGARIIFVCDAYEAMTSKRPYQPCLPEAEAVAELRANAGRQFDPQIVEAFCRALDRPQARVAPAPGARRAQTVA